MSAPIVFVHGLRTSSSMWDAERALLEEHGWRTSAPDLPGHGSRRGEPFTREAAVRTVVDALGELDEPAHLVGCSLGGMLAIHVAALDGVAVRSLVAAACSTQPTRGTAAAYGWVIGLVDRLSGDEGIRWALGPAGAEAYLRQGRAGLDVVVEAMRAVSTLQLRADLARVEAPVTILNGRYDQLRWQERSFAAAAPLGRLVVLPFGGHTVSLTRPEAYTEVLERLLRDAEELSSGAGPRG